MPVERLAAARRVLERQLAVATAVVVVAALVAVLRPGRPREVTLSAAIVVELWAAAALMLVIAWSREHVRDRIGDGEDPLGPHLEAEARRISAPGYRERLASRLQRALADARDWPELAIASRPPPAIRNLVTLAPEVAEIVALLRNPDAPVRGVALVDRLLRGGYASVLYGGPPERLERELGRIRFILLAQVDPGATPGRPGAPAASRTVRGAPSPVRRPGRS
jgi:hypothetical protein